MTTTLLSSRAFERDLAQYITSRGERRRLRQRQKNAYAWKRSDSRVLRAFERVRAAALCTKTNPEVFPGKTIQLRSWKEASHTTRPGCDLRLRPGLRKKTISALLAGKSSDDEGTQA